MFDFRAMVRVLAQQEVEFAIVGGLAGVMQGAPLHTQDLDVLYSLEAPNPSRLPACPALALSAPFLSLTRSSRMTRDGSVPICHTWSLEG